MAGAAKSRCDGFTKFTVPLVVCSIGVCGFLAKQEPKSKKSNYCEEVRLSQASPVPSVRAYVKRGSQRKRPVPGALLAISSCSGINYLAVTSNKVSRPSCGEAISETLKKALYEGRPRAPSQ